MAGPGGDMQWCFSQVKGAIDDDVLLILYVEMFPCFSPKSIS
uniref:Uncharacterized protein n=1 Tax=Xiphophorus couchianus TaxID=32473 RepID=A0A3B5L828_9TELE